MDLARSITTFCRKYSVLAIHDHKTGVYNLQRGPRQVIVTEAPAGMVRLVCSGPAGERELLVDLQEAIRLLYHDPEVITG